MTLTIHFQPKLFRMLTARFPSGEVPGPIKLHMLSPLKTACQLRLVRETVRF